MTRFPFAVFAFIASLAFAGAPVPKHSFAPEFDERQPVVVSGRVTRVEWSNPHARFYLEVQDAAGKKRNWRFELASPGVLKHEGWRRNSLSPGDVVTVQGYRARNGSNAAGARTVTLAGTR